MPQFSLVVGYKACSTLAKRLGATYPSVQDHGRLGARPIAKSADPKTVIAAEKLQTRLERAALNTFRLLRNRVTLVALQQALEAGSIYGVLSLLDVESALESIATGAGLAAKETSLLEAVQDTYRAGALATVEELEGVPVQKAKKPTVGTEMSFDLVNPEAMQFLQTYVFNLIREISKETREAVREIVLEAFRTGGHPYEQAREIRAVIGLTQRQALAVRNYRRMLEQGNVEGLREALTRELRDGRFDNTVLAAVLNKTKLKKPQIDRMVQRYQERLLAYRAKMIARTESLRASNIGQQEVWGQAVRQGLLNATKTRRKWIVAPGERTCELCRDVPKRNPNGVMLNQPFQTELGPVQVPPLHPNCRCTTALFTAAY